MLSKTMQDALSEHINAEFASAYLYLSMALYFEGQSLPGFAQWMRVQNKEEHAHAMKMLDHVVDRGGKVVLATIEKPASDFKSTLDIFERTVAHEQKVTGLINTLYALAIKENDYATMEMLQWYIKEQVEEEKNVTQILDQLKMAGDKGSTLVMLDHRIGKRGT
ncbi:MAG TPA: ferritin [Polyangia bacterium]